MRLIWRRPGLIGGLALAALVAVALTGLGLRTAMASVDMWQLVINTATSILAFLLVALLQNLERRKDEATHAKLNALATGLRGHATCHRR